MQLACYPQTLAMGSPGHLPLQVAHHTARPARPITTVQQGFGWDQGLLFSHLPDIPGAMEVSRQQEVFTN